MAPRATESNIISSQVVLRSCLCLSQLDYLSVYQPVDFQRDYISHWINLPKANPDTLTPLIDKDLATYVQVN